MPPYVIEEAALLFESGAWKELDFNIVVVAAEEIRITRVMERDGISRGEVLARLASQIDPGEAAKLADMVIRNDGKDFLLPQVIAADRTIRKRMSLKKKW
jgi:dephospho-CoA kinase